MDGCDWCFGTDCDDSCKVDEAESTGV